MAFRTSYQAWSKGLGAVLLQSNKRSLSLVKFPYLFRQLQGADKSLARPGSKQANVSVRMVWISFGALLCRKRKNFMTARASMLLKSRASLTCFRACFLPGRAKDLSARRYLATRSGQKNVKCTYFVSLFTTNKNSSGLFVPLFRYFPT